MAAMAMRRFAVRLMMAGAAAATLAGCAAMRFGAPHYALDCDAGQRAEFASLLEQQYAELARYFGEEPTERLPIRVFADQRAYTAALETDQLSVPSSGGYYSPTNHVAYLFRQPSTYYTRQLLLHEATHQFHFLAATDNERPSGGEWYVEGLAEYFALHHWDGRRLRGGAVPTISLEDYPAKAMAQLERAGWNLHGIVRGEIEADRPAAWAIVHWLMNTRGGAAKRLFAALDRREEAGAAWEREIGSDAAAHVRELRTWVAGQQQPWEQVWIGWDEVGEELAGESDVMGVAVLKRPVDRMSVDLRVTRRGEAAGVVTGFRSEDDFWVFEVVGDRAAVRAVHFVRREPREVTVHAIARRGERCRFELVRRGGEAELRVEGQRVAVTTGAGRWGVCVNDCGARFRVETEPGWRGE